MRLYNVLFTVFLLLSAPYYFVRLVRRGNWRAGFFQRFGVYDGKIKQALTNRFVIWMHAVSVGEVNVCTQLIKALEPHLPGVKIVVSTTTTTGMGELKRKLPSRITKIYFPIDRTRYVVRALNIIGPDAIVLVESEIWPNFIAQAKKRNIPIFLVNARLSERSYRWYRRLKFFFSPLFAAFSGVCAQNEADAAKLRELGCRPEAIQVVGNIKFDAAVLEEHHFLDVPSMLRQLGVEPSARIIVAGSTHPGEEAIMAEVFLRLRKRFPDLFLVVVPRHFERGKQVGRELAARGLRFVCRTEVTSQTHFGKGELDCLLVNTTGELRRFYEHATVIFVGKSLTAEGGQNPIEPAALGKPIIFGPNMQNFAQIAKSFVERGGAIQVKDAAELEDALSKLLSDEAYRAEMGRIARLVVRENQGAVDRTAEMITNHLQKRGLILAKSD